MRIDATKKQPTTGISELQEFELEYQIRLRAYELYEARSRKDGHELEDWFRAEKEIREKKVIAAAAWFTQVPSNRKRAMPGSSPGAG
jgi:hypothetical protein